METYRGRTTRGDLDKNGVPLSCVRAIAAHSFKPFLEAQSSTRTEALTKAKLAIPNMTAIGLCVTPIHAAVPDDVNNRAAIEGNPNNEAVQRMMLFFHLEELGRADSRDVQSDLYFTPDGIGWTELGDCERGCWRVYAPFSKVLTRLNLGVG